MTHKEILETFPLAVSLLKAEEGFKARPYRCTEDKLTIGYGYNITAHGHTEAEAAEWVWSRQRAEDELLEEMQDIIAALDSRYPAWRDKLDATREAVAISSCYQLGLGGAFAFKNTIARIQAGDYEGAAQGILASKWARQDPSRAQRNAEAMRTGKLPEVVRGVKIFDADGDGGMVQTQGQPPAYVLPTQRPGTVNPQSPLVLPPISTPVPAVPLIPRLSKKLCVVIAGAVILLLNDPLRLGLSPQDSADMVKLLASYLIGQAGVDAFKPFAMALLKDGAK